MALRIMHSRRSIITALVLIVVGFLWFAYGWLDMRRSDEAFHQLLAQNATGLLPEIEYHTVDGRRLRSVELGHDSLPLIVFIHGAPSSSSFWTGLLRDSVLLSQAQLLAIDRPGYGYSGFGRPEVSVARQAALIAPLIERQRREHESIILHGSSYGGTVAARIAMDYPHLVDGLLLQSASVAPGEEKTFWISYPTSHWLISWMMPATIRVANAEKLSHRTQLEAMASRWDDICSPTIVLHGTNDQLIYPSNAEFLRERITNAFFLQVNMVKGKGHDLLWTGRQLLVQSLLTLVKKPWAAPNNLADHHERIGQD